MLFCILNVKENLVIKTDSKGRCFLERSRPVETFSNFSKWPKWLLIKKNKNKPITKLTTPQQAEGISANKQCIVFQLNTVSKINFYFER